MLLITPRVFTIYSHIITPSWQVNLVIHLKIYATITNCLKWILFILDGFNLFASLLCLSGISQFYLSSSRIQTCLLVCGILELNFYGPINHYWNNYARTRPLFSSPTQTWRPPDLGSIFPLELSH